MTILNNPEEYAREAVARWGEHDAVCESCDRLLMARFGDEWEKQPAQDADGVTTVTVCSECQEAES